MGILAGASLFGCGGDGSETPQYTNLRVYSSKYEAVDWASDQRLKAQHHDHSGTEQSRILRYDAARYDVIGLMTYSGNGSAGYAWKQRRWPPEDWLPESFLSSLANIKVLLPNAEEIGDQHNHVTSPGLRSYVEGWSNTSGSIKQSWQYASMPELFTLIRRGGGIPCLAHPWQPARDYREFSGTFCVEIYSAYAEAQRRKNAPDFVSVDRNAMLIANWDRALTGNQNILGIAVNDHYGPDSAEPSIGADILDSGKIIVLSKSATLDEYLDAFGRGAILAVRDLGSQKDQHAQVDAITVGTSSISIQTSGDVRWISEGRLIAEGSTLSYSTLPVNARYVRAEIAGGPDTVVYTQAFTIRPVGDIDGDYDVDAIDSGICASLGTSPNPLHVAACDAAAGTP